MISLLIPLIQLCSPIFVVGHRGSGCSQPKCSSRYPENTIPSFMAAFSNGADAVELDVWISRDDQLVITHRDRTDASKEHLHASLAPLGSVATPKASDYEHSKRNFFPIKLPWSYEQPSRGKYLSDDYRMRHQPVTYIPTLGEVIENVCPTGKKIVIEMKGNNEQVGPRVIAELEKYNAFDCVHTISSFEWKQHRPLPPKHDLMKSLINETRVTRALLMGVSLKISNDFMLDGAKYYNASYLHPSCGSLDGAWRKTLTKAKERGMKTSCYFGTTNEDEAAVRKALTYPLDEICTNNVPLVTKLVGKTVDRGVVKKKCLCRSMLNSLQDISSHLLNAGIVSNPPDLDFSKKNPIPSMTPRRKTIVQDDSTKLLNTLPQNRSFDDNRRTSMAQFEQTRALGSMNTNTSLSSWLDGITPFHQSEGLDNAMDTPDLDLPIIPSLDLAHAKLQTSTPLTGIPELRRMITPQTLKARIERIVPSTAQPNRGLPSHTTPSKTPLSKPLMKTPHFKSVLSTPTHNGEPSRITLHNPLTTNMSFDNANLNSTYPSNFMAQSASDNFAISQSPIVATQMDVIFEPTGDNANFGNITDPKEIDTPIVRQKRDPEPLKMEAKTVRFESSAQMEYNPVAVVTKEEYNRLQVFLKSQVSFDLLSSMIKRLNSVLLLKDGAAHNGETAFTEDEMREQIGEPEKMKPMMLMLIALKRFKIERRGTQTIYVPIKPEKSMSSS
ncbi:putative Glycerophosphoryl diester phosphodiesterase family protein [Blattamonas nauphoetae]|uniref:Glycerophosphoryl diester phosphodiesterase family protein n=1 Tax=Blattamonas nauphoetae TaxID=2049346 RepID=A0ABQ9XE38_9EUKA|nr:putative Glycerophosphoryl diester phosphodiesterase family protein [Blattamonas nauphoetae]